MAKRRKDQEITEREELLIEHLAQGKGKQEAGIAAGYSPVSAHVTVSRLLNSPKFQQAYNRRIEGLKADTNEVHALLASHLRADLADFEGCIDDTGMIDLKKAKKRGISHLAKKLRIRRIPVRDKEGKVFDYETRTEIEIHDSQSAARTLADIFGMKKLPDENPDKLNRDIEQLAAERLAAYAKFVPEDEARLLLAQDAPELASALVQ